jgi:hypothetical protein
MLRLLAFLALLTSWTALGCGFGLADDTGQPIPSDYWKWSCPDGSAPSADAGCPSVDAGIGD